MPKKQSANSTKDNNVNASTPQGFLLRFIQRNHQRREIDEQSFRSFNKLVMILGKQLSKSTTQSDVEGFVMIVRTIFQNFDQLNKSTSTLALYIQLLQITMSIFEEAVNLELPKQVCCQFLQIFWPLFVSKKKEQSFKKIQQKISNLTMPKQISESETMNNIHQYKTKTLPELYSPDKYQNFINSTFKQTQGGTSMKTVLKAFMSIEGQIYFDSILKLLLLCVKLSDYDRFRKLLKIFMAIGNNSLSQSSHMLILLPKILGQENKIEFIYQIFANCELQKLYGPTQLFYVSITILINIFSTKVINQKSIALIQKISKFSHIFKKLDQVQNQDKLINLYNKLLQVLFCGKDAQQPHKIAQSLIRKAKSEIQKQKSAGSPNKSNKSIESQNNKQPMEEQKLQQQQKQKVQQKLQALKPEQIKSISLAMKRLFISFQQNDKIFKIVNKIYKNNQDRVKQFMRLSKQNVAHINSECLQLILAVYVPLISEQQNLSLFANISNQDSALIKVIKLRILEKKIQGQKLDSESIFNNYYKQAHSRLVSKQGKNFDFLVLTVLHEHITNPHIVIDYLLRTCTQKLQLNNQQKSIYFRSNVALLASILDLHQNIAIKLSYNKFKIHVNKLNNKFLVQDFLSLNQIKQNKLFAIGTKIDNTHSQKDQQLLKIGNFIDSLFRVQKQIGTLINLQNSQQSSYYYMILIELCSVCMQKVHNIGSQSKQIQSIIKIRKNNKYSLPITLGNQISKSIQEMLKQEGQVEEFSQVVLLHLLIKFQQIIPTLNTNNSANSVNTNTNTNINSENAVLPQCLPQQQSITNIVVNQNQIRKQRLQQLSKQIQKIIIRLGSQPKLQTLKLLNKNNEFRQEQLAHQFLSLSIDQIQAKKSKLKDHIKHFHIIKFYSESLANKDMLLVMLNKTAIKILEKLETVPRNTQTKQIKQQNKQIKNSNQQVKQTKQQKQLRELKIVYDNRLLCASQKDRKMVNIYIKTRLLILSSSKDCKNGLTMQQIKSITKFLQDNHSDVEQMIINQQNTNLNSTNDNCKFSAVFKTKVHFIKYLLQLITDTTNLQLECNQSTVHQLNLLKTLIDNNSNILVLCNQILFAKLQNNDILQSLILNRTKMTIKILKQLQEKHTKLQVTGTDQNKKQMENQEVKMRKFQKQQQNILQQNRKIYQIIAKIITSKSDSKYKLQNVITIVQKLIQLDQYSDIFVSVHIVREFLNICPIIKCLMKEELYPDLADRIFGYLMALRQIYTNVIMDPYTAKGLTKGSDQSSFTISTIINFFVQSLYSKFYQHLHPSKFNDSLVVVESDKQNTAIISESKSQQQKKKLLMPMCSQNQKKSCFRCLKCDSIKELCLNCTVVCHKNHPVIYVQPSIRISKSCQCSEEFCKINPNFEKKKQVKQKRKQKIKQYTYKSGVYYPVKTTFQQISDRYRDPRDLRDPRQLRELRELRELRQLRDPRQLRQPRQVRQPRQLRQPSRQYKPIREPRDSPQYLLQFERQFGRDVYQEEIDDEEQQWNNINGIRQNNFQTVVIDYPNDPNPFRWPPQISAVNNSIPPPPIRGNPSSFGTRLIGNGAQIPVPSPSPFGAGNNAPISANLPNIFAPGRNLDSNEPYTYYASRNNARNNSYQYYGSKISEQQMQGIIQEKQQRIRRQKQNLRAIRQRQKQAIRAAMLNSKNQSYQQFSQRFLDKSEALLQQQILDQQSEANDKFQQEDYESSLLKLEGLTKKQIQANNIKNKQIINETVNQSYLLPIFMEMTVQMCENKVHASKDQQPQINWHLKLQNPITSNQNIVYSTKKMCPSKTFHTKLNRNDVYHESPAPLVSRTPIAITQKFVFVLSGPKISTYMKQQLLTYLLQKNQNPIVYPSLFDQSLNFEPHSISVGHLNLICIAGLHNIVLYEYDTNDKFISTEKQLRHSINNNNINKIKLTRFGIFVGLSRQIRLLNHSLQPKAVFKMPDALVKQWCVMENSPNSFTVYITISDGYILFAQGNMSTSGDVNFVKKIIDSRTNRPVGFFVISKKIDDCGTLMLSTFKDKSIGHSIGRLSGDSTLTDINYIKLNSQGLEPVYEKYNLMGLSDIVSVKQEKKQQGRQLFIVTIYKQQNHDNFALHRGLLGIIKIKQDLATGFSKYQTQILCPQQQKCEYFEVVWLEDKKSWFIISLHEDGSLRVTVPNKISKSTIQKQLIAIKQKKCKADKHQKANSPKDDLGMTQLKTEQTEGYQKLSKSIKQNINIKSIKDSITLKKVENNQFLNYIQNSDLLRTKQDFVLTMLSNNLLTKTKQFDIKLINKKKIITGLCLYDCSDVILPTRKIENVFQIGFTYEESLHFYAFGSFKISIIKKQQCEFSRQKSRNTYNKIKDLDDSKILQERLLGMSATILKNIYEVGIYGQNFQPHFKIKIPDIMKLLEKNMEKTTPFQLLQEQRLIASLKNCNLLLSNCISSNNLVISSQQSQDFVGKIMQRLVSNKQKINLYNKVYSQIKPVIYKCLKVHEIIGEEKKQRHVFYDKFHPLRCATENKIHNLYQSLAKGEISDGDVLFLVNQLYGFLCGSLQEDVGAVNQTCEIDVLFYFLAKYPAMLYKLHKKVKVVEGAKILYRLIPLYLFNYSITKSLGYHNQWVLPALCEIVGKAILADDFVSKPSVLSRFILYKYLKLSQTVKLQEWIRNIQGIDALQCLKQQLPLGKQPSMGNNNPQSGFFGGLGGYGQFELEDEQALLRKVMQLSKMDEKINLGADFDIPIEGDQMLKQQQRQMQQETHAVQIKNVSQLIKDLIQNCFKQIDYETSNLEHNCQRVVIIYVIFKLGICDQKQKIQGSQDTLQFLCNSIQNIIQKLCSGYHEFTNQNTHMILMMWLNLFGLIYKNCDKESAAYKTYQNVKQQILATLNKFKIQHIKKLNNIPNLFARRIKGAKLNTKADFIYGFISVLQKPCQANFVLLTLGCYWLFPHDKQYYNKTKYIETIRQNEKIGNIKKIHETALTNIDTWKQVGDPDWLVKWVEAKKQDWPEAMELLTLYYE